jgi:histone-lysine N-methyltransferase SETMAR
MRMKKFNGASRLRKFWNYFGPIQMSSFPARLVTMDEIWLYHYDPETKQQSTEWRQSCSTQHPKKFQVQKSAGKILASIFWDQDGILLIDYLPKG